MTIMINQQDIIQFNKTGYPIATNLITQFTNWARIWMSSNNTNKRKRKIYPHENKRETDIRTRTNHYDQEHHLYKPLPPPTPAQRSNLYRATCQKLRLNKANNNHYIANSNSCQPRHPIIDRKLTLGAILHVRSFWDNLERDIYQELSNSIHYIAPSKRFPFNPDRPGSLYLPKASNKRTISGQSHSRESFASSKVIYTTIPTSKKHVSVRIQPIDVPRVHRRPMEDDDDIPLGSLQFGRYRPSPLR
ncbi:hypothetical protein BDB01DRAFT_780675 [Pilobolus umbonatus]|nr:hypothetical protein BDB01DRAFT_780675 [Pilobolus umbonatus]